MSPISNKQKYAVYAYPETMDAVDARLGQANCSSRSEFIEKAVSFFTGYLSGAERNAYLPVAVTAAIEGVLNVSEDRVARLLFKQAVELSMLMNVLAAKLNVDGLDLTKLRGKCVADVKRSNGQLTFEDAVRFQQGG